MNGIRLFFQKLSLVLGEKDKRDILGVLFIGFIVGLLELIGLALLIGMLQIFSNPSILEKFNLLDGVYIDTDSKLFALAVGFGVLLFYAIKTVLSVVYSKKIAKLASNLYIDLSKGLFSNYLKYYYQDISHKNSSDYNQTLVIEADNLSLMIISLINFAIHLIIIVMLYVYMLVLDFYLTSLLTIVITASIFVYKKYVIGRLVIMGDERIQAVNEYMKLIKVAFSNYRIIKSLDNDFIDEKLDTTTSKYKKARIDMLYWAEIPRIAIEFIMIFAMIGLVVYVKVAYENTQELLLIVSAYALALFRMLPSISRVIIGVNNFNVYKGTLDLIHAEATNEIEDVKSDSRQILFTDKISMKDISYTYPNSDTATLKSISLVISKGEKIAFVGESGSGKSTLMDILIGLHIPTAGIFSVDGVEIKRSTLHNWRKNVAFVPQKAILFESTLKDNITLGKAYDKSLFDRVLKDAYMYETIVEKGGDDICVGDEGAGFSGGQIQRLAFARALYQERELLFLDEATSSLDEEIEMMLVENLLKNYSDKTIVAIVHKAKLAEKFDKIYEIRDGSIVVVKG